jgi:hypothetical protein
VDLLQSLACSVGCATQIKAQLIDAELFTTRKEQPATSNLAAAACVDLHFDGDVYECGAGLPYSS